MRNNPGACVLAAVLFVGALLPPGLSAAEQPGGNLLRGVERDVLNGDIAKAMAQLRQAPAERESAFVQQQRACLLTRFDRASPAFLAIPDASPVVQAIAWEYQKYWWHALREPRERAAHEARLQQALSQLLDVPGSASFESLEARVQDVLQREGWHSQLGRTPPLRDLMLWKHDVLKHYRVALPEGEQEVPAHLLSGFALLGWSSYGRCEHGSSGGWATDEALYAIVPAYRHGIDSEEFEVVFLAHEAQHFADKRGLAPMQDWELEYRAKLVELAMGNRTSQERLAKFVGAPGNDPAAPHPYANARVVDDLKALLGADPADVSLEALKRGARELLVRDTRKRRPADTQG